MAFDAARATVIVSITANIVTATAYISIGTRVSAVPKISLKIAVIAWFQAKAVTRPNAAVISTANLSKISSFIVVLDSSDKRNYSPKSFEDTRVIAISDDFKIVIKKIPPMIALGKKRFHEVKHFSLR